MAADVAKSTSPAGLWSNLRSIIPRWRTQPVSGKDARPAVQVVACAAAAAQDVPVDGTPHASPAQRERQDDQGAAHGLDFGYQRGLERRFRAVREVGKGGNGVVRVVQELSTGTEWALKSVPKVLTDPALSDAKRAGHVEAVKREVEVLGRLRGCLNVAALEHVYEDDTHVHMVLELCRGGELHHFIGETHYSERTVASYMRAVLRTLAQCHAQHILHRDVKPGNFLLASEDPAARLKAIDFGLAVFFSDEALPRTDLGLEGTPWFMAPETLRSEVYPASDVWAAGVMAHQLLTGRFPFDDRSNPFAPSLSKVWRSILVDDLDMKRGHWDGISSEAKDFVATLLNKDHSKRPSAREALQHPWLQGPGTSERGKGKKLSMGVVQRIQRYSQGSAFKRGVLDMIAEELLREGPDTAERAVPIGRGAVPIITDPQASPLEYLYEHLSFTDRSLVDREEVADGLAQLGYRLSAEEIERLLDQLDPGNTGKVGKSQVAASQMDWSVLQQSQTERWLKCVRRAFQDLDTDGDGIISSGDMVAMLRNKLPKAEVEAAVRHALHEAARRSEGSRHRGATGAAAALASGGEGSVHSTGSGGDSVRDGMSFRQFLRMLRAGSADSLDVYDDRYGSNGSHGSLGSLSGLAASSSLADKSMRGSCHAGSLLDPIREAA